MGKRKIGFFCKHFWEVNEKDLRNKKLTIDEVISTIQESVSDVFVVGEIKEW